MAYIIRIIFSIIGIVVGFSACASFASPVLYNYEAAGFGAFSGLVATVTLIVHIRNRKGYWTPSEHTSLIRLMYSGCFVQLIGVVAFVVYLVLGTIQYQDINYFKIKGESYFLVCVWCFMTWKWGFLLFYFCRKYIRQINKPDRIFIVSEADN